jgi:hypothetical protein
MKRYKIKVKNDRKALTFIIHATDEQTAKNMLCKVEGCPLSAIISVELLPYYVTMTDKFMSGWGEAKGKINKYVIRCSTYQEAEKIELNAHRRPEMKHINIVNKLPYYSPERYVLSLEAFEDMGVIWKRI